MLPRLIREYLNKNVRIIRNFSSGMENKLVVEHQNDTLSVEEPSILSNIYDEEDLTHVVPYLKPTYNFAAYVNKSETLQQLLKLGVNLHKLEKSREVPQFIMGLNFNNDIKNHVLFLHELGLENEAIGELITRNPFIFKEDLDNLHTRINYLKYKKFTDEMILRIVEKNPFWLSYTTKDIDEKLGFFQHYFGLAGKEVRDVAVKKPTLITWDLGKIKLNTFVLKEEMGFTALESKKILLDKPNIFMKHQVNLLKTFEYLHKTMNISLERIVETPEILTCRQKRLKERHTFLEKLGKAQYNPVKANYIALTTLVSGTDAVFATEVAKSSVQIFNGFLKTM